MKSLKALEQKYKLINEAGAPVPTTAAPRAAQPAAATAAPAAVPTAQPSILTPEELKSLNAADSPVQPNKIDAIAKDPQQLKAFEQNELPGIINGLVASMAQTHPEALKELLDAAKTNDVNKVNSILAKYAKLTPAAQATGTAAPASATSGAPATTPVTGESIKLNEGFKELAQDTWDALKSIPRAILNYFKENPSKLIYGTLGLIIAGPLGAAALPLLVSAIEKGQFAAGDKDPTNKTIKVTTKQVTDATKWDDLKELFISSSKGPDGKLVANNKLIRQVSLGVIDDLAGYFQIALTPQEVERITNGGSLNLLSVTNASTDPQFVVSGGEKGSYTIRIIKDGNIWTAPPPAATPAVTPAVTPAATPAVTPAVTPAASVLTTSFNYNASKVLKEYYRNSKPLPIETANKK